MSEIHSEFYNVVFQVNPRVSLKCWKRYGDVSAILVSSSTPPSIVCTMDGDELAHKVKFVMNLAGLLFIKWNSWHVNQSTKFSSVCGSL